MKQDFAKHIETGSLGEDLAAKWLQDSGHTILERNYLRKWGEIDIVSCVTGVVHFVEVKTVSYETIEKLNLYVSRETYRPEDNVHPEKIKRLNRAIETWILEHKEERLYQVDVVAVHIVPDKKYAEVSLLEQIIAE